MYITWTDDPHSASLMDHLSEPDILPFEGTPDIMIEHPIQSGERSDALNNSTTNDVSPLSLVVCVSLDFDTFTVCHGPPADGCS